MKYPKGLAFLFISLMVLSATSMEKLPFTPVNSFPDGSFFKALPLDIINLYLDTWAKQPESSKKNFRDLCNLGKTCKFFTQKILYNSALNGVMINLSAQKCRGKLDRICPHDLVFAAAYQLNTAGAKKWLTQKYFSDPANFKIIAQSFFQRLDPGNTRTPLLQRFIKEVIPTTLPGHIQRRIHFILNSEIAQSDTFPKNFMQELWPTYKAMPQEGQPPESFIVCLEHNSLEQVEKFHLKLKNTVPRVSTWADPDLASAKGEIPLNQAFNTQLFLDLQHKSEHICQGISLLLKYGANPNNRDAHYLFPLLKALEARNIKALDLLLAAGANPDTHIHLLDHMKIKMTTPLIHAINQYGMPEINLFFLYGADPNLPDSDGRLPLTHAIAAGALDKVKKLLEAGAHVDYKRHPQEESLIQFARKKGHIVIAELLEEHQNKIN